MDQMPAVVWTTDTELTFTSNMGTGLSDLKLAPDQVIGMSLFEHFHTDDPDFQPIAMHRRALEGDSVTYEGEWEGRSHQSYLEPLRDSAGRLVGVIGVALDITERKQAEQALAQYSQELVRSNADLQQFAYVASHDLLEPLRTVSNYVQLLQRRYENQLDAKADKFIAYAVDGTARMHTLLQDLLKFSRVGTRGKEFVPTNAESVFDQVVASLRMAIKENGAVISHDPLPVVIADDVQLSQLFQNLIANAVKFHGEEPPQVHVSAQQQDNEWIFSIQDNGIGIDPRFADRIFEIFHQLHGRADYSGSGMGLAICKKVVERHGGRIWMESEPGEGSTFYFTLPSEKENTSERRNER